MPIGSIGAIERREIHLVNRRLDKPREVTLRQPLAHVRRHQKHLLTTAFDEVLGHERIVLARPDGPGLCDSLRRKRQSSVRESAVGYGTVAVSQPRSAQTSIVAAARFIV